MSLWDWKAKLYDKSRKCFPFNLILAKEVENVRNLISEIHLNQKKILDVGTGTGTMLCLFPDNAQVFASDRSFDMIAHAKLKRQVKFVVADSNILPFKSFSFDLVTAVGLFEYQKNQLGFLKELQRVMNPNGFSVVTFSQLALLNFLRNFLGHRVYLISIGKFNHLLGLTDFNAKIIKKSLLQRQILIFIKNAEKKPKS